MNPEHHASTPKYNPEDESKRQRRQPEDPDHHKSPDRPGAEPRLMDELTPAEQDEKEKAREEATAALVAIYETLQHYPNKPGQPETRAAIDQTPLRELKRAYKAQLETVIVGQDLAVRGEQKFIERGLEVLSLWIHLQGLKRGTDRELENLRADMEQR